MALALAWALALVLLCRFHGSALRLKVRSAIYLGSSQLASRISDWSSPDTLSHCLRCLPSQLLCRFCLFAEFTASHRLRCWQLPHLNGLNQLINQGKLFVEISVRPAIKTEWNWKCNCPLAAKNTFIAGVSAGGVSSLQNSLNHNVSPYKIHIIGWSNIILVLRGIN